MRVFVIDRNRKPLDPCPSARARYLLSKGRAAVFRRYPFTIILKDRAVEESTVHGHRVKIDPGAKVTGIAIVQEGTERVIAAAEITHRGQAIKASLDSRRTLRRNRRARKTRYRKPRFDNRTRREGWLPPSLESRVANVETWVSRFRRYCPVSAVSMELVRFDFQKEENPEISGVEYQQGTLAGYECREYLLEKWHRTCAYCGKTGVPLQVDHIRPRSRGGSDRVSNLTLACEPCNRRKGNRPIEEFLKGKPGVLAKITLQAKAPLKDASAVNTTHWELFRGLKATGLPVECGSGGRTKFNRTTRGLPKAHWLDAACVGASPPNGFNAEGVRPLLIKARGHGKRQRCTTNKYGFPIRHKSRSKFMNRFQTGDVVRAVNFSGKYPGVHTGRVVVQVKKTVHIGRERIPAHPHRCTAVHRADGYEYSLGENFTHYKTSTALLSN